MLWEGRRQSDNVEIECLGKSVPSHSPDAAAAEKCQEEVAQLRQNFIANVNHDEPEGRYDHAFMLFNADQKREDRKADARSMSNLVGAVPSQTDSYFERTDQFAEFLDGFSAKLDNK